MGYPGSPTIKGNGKPFSIQRQIRGQALTLRCPIAEEIRSGGMPLWSLWLKKSFLTRDLVKPGSRYGSLRQDSF